MAKMYRTIVVIGDTENVVRASYNPYGKDAATGKSARTCRAKLYPCNTEAGETGIMGGMLVIADAFEQIANEEAYKNAVINLVTFDKLGWIARAGLKRIKGGMSAFDAAEEVVSMHDSRITSEGEAVQAYSQEYCDLIEGMLASFEKAVAHGVSITVTDQHDDYEKARLFGKEIDKGNYVVRHSQQLKNDIAMAKKFLPKRATIVLSDEEDNLAI